jgi:hypothetical protein
MVSATRIRPCLRISNQRRQSFALRATSLATLAGVAADEVTLGFAPDQLGPDLG